MNFPSQQPLTDEQVVALATAAAPSIPAASELFAADAQPVTEHVVAPFGNAVVADLASPWTGRIAILIGTDLVKALASSPMGPLDLAAALQPSFDNAAQVIGASVGRARQVILPDLLAEVGMPARVVPLVGDTVAAAVIVPDSVAMAVAPTAAAPAFENAFNTVDSNSPVVESVPAPQDFTSSSAPVTHVTSRGIEMLHGVVMDVTVELGRTRMSVRELLALTPGTVLELDRAAGSPADLLVNGRLIARGEVVVVDEDFGLRITEVVSEEGVQGRAS